MRDGVDELGESSWEQRARQLLSPVSPVKFLRDYYRRRGVRIPAGRPGQFDDLLTVEEVESHFRTPHFFETTTVALHAPGEAQPEIVSSASVVYDRLSKGATLQIGDFERALTDRHPLIQIFRVLEELCQAPARGVTVFLSQSRGSLTRHFDPYEIFTLQLVGTKRWEMHEFRPPSELDRDLNDAEDPVETFHLSPGDLLYTPKGQVHRVLPGEGISLSVALVYDPPTWMKLLDHLASVVEDDERFWTALPPPPGGSSAGFEARRQALIEALNQLDPRDFDERVQAERAASIPGLPANHLPSALAVSTIEIDSQVRRRSGPRPVVRVDGKSALLISAFDDPIRAPLEALAGLRFIAESTEAFTPADLGGQLSDSAKLAIVRKLTRRGIVQIV